MSFVPTPYKVQRRGHRLNWAGHKVCPYPSLSGRSAAVSRITCCAASSKDHAVAAKRELVEALKRDLLRQYDRPFAMDFSIYSPDILFTDPLTRLESRLRYRGMLLTIALIVRLLFKRDTVKFELDECELVDSKIDDNSPGYIRTYFRTTGTTRWAPADAPPFVISGVDKFHLEENRNNAGTFQIVHHESTWDQSPDEVKSNFLRRE